MWGINKKDVHHKNQPGYKHFIEELAWAFKASNTGHKPMLGDITLYMDLETNHDIDAVIKQLLDALQMAGVFKNDNQVTKMIIGKKSKEKKDMDKIGITVIEECGNKPGMPKSRFYLRGK